MSSGAEKPIREMIPLALHVLGFLMEYCERVAIAGSIRRGKPMVRDIELVVQAREGVLDRRCDELLRLGVFTKRTKSNGALLSWGSRYKAAWYADVPVDIFIVLPDRQWGPTMLIRTGPGDANRVLVTQQGIRNGDDNYGILPKVMRFSEGRIWAHTLAMNTPEEEDVFRCVGLPWIAPHKRSVEEYQKWSNEARQTLWTMASQGYRQIMPKPTDGIYLDGQVLQLSSLVLMPPEDEVEDIEQVAMPI